MVAPDVRAAEFGLDAEHAGGWFPRLVGHYARHASKRTERIHVEAEENADERAHALITRACLKSGLTGAGAAAVSTGAVVVTAEMGGVAALGAAPVAAAAIGADLAYRSMLHVDLAFSLARVFGVKLDPSDPNDFWRLYALIFKRTPHDRRTVPGRTLVGDVLSIHIDEVGDAIGRLVLGESVLRNAVPFVGIVASAATNWIMTRRLGDTIRRYMRYQRAIGDALAHAARAVKEHLGLLIEGVWFIFTADGTLTPEETVTLAQLLDDLPPNERQAVTARFVEDELDWAERIEQIPEPAREDFLYALEVASAVDKKVGVPERKILHRAAHHLGRPFDRRRVERMIAEFESHGVLS